MSSLHNTVVLCLRLAFNQHSVLVTTEKDPILPSSSVFGVLSRGPSEMPRGAQCGFTAMNEHSPIVYVVDDEPAVSISLKRLLRSVGLETRTYSSAQEFLLSERPDAPGCLVLDVRLPGLSGLDLQQELNAAKIDLPVIFITGHGDIPMSVRAMKAGAIEFLTKPFREQDMLEAIERAIKQSRIVKQHDAVIRTLQKRYALLTPREREVFPRVTSGLPNKQIAGLLGTSEKTIKVHRGHVMQKMKAESLADLIQMAAKLGVRSD